LASTPAGATSGTQFAVDFFNAAGDYLWTDDPTAANPVTPADPDRDYYAGVIDIEATSPPTAAAAARTM